MTLWLVTFSPKLCLARLCAYQLKAMGSRVTSMTLLTMSDSLRHILALNVHIQWSLVDSYTTCTCMCSVNSMTQDWHWWKSNKNINLLINLIPELSREIFLSEILKMSPNTWFLIFIKNKNRNKLNEYEKVFYKILTFIQCCLDIWWHFYRLIELWIGMMMVL